MSLRNRLLSTLRRANGAEMLRNELMAHINNQTADLMAHTNHQTAELVAHFNRVTGLQTSYDQLRELYGIMGRSLFRLRHLDDLKIDVHTNKPVAYDSPDHLMPWGTRIDNSVHLPFNAKLARWIPPESLSVLDLGCAGGGFVKSVLEMGCLAVGIEGSDYSKQKRRAEWATIPDYLFTADVTEPFTVVGCRGGQPEQALKFSVITAWEFLEHIRREQLPAVFRNIDAHLQPRGVVIMSVSPRPDVVDNVVLHQTVESREWWLAECQRHGFVHHDRVLPYFGEDWVRNQENAPGSFPLVLSRQGETLPPLLPT